MTENFWVVQPNPKWPKIPEGGNVEGTYIFTRQLTALAQLQYIWHRVDCMHCSISCLGKCFPQSVRTAVKYRTVSKFILNPLLQDLAQRMKKMETGNALSA